MWLTPHQAEYLAMYANGLRIAEIAEKHVISRWTVVNTLKAARERLEANNTARAIVCAIASGQLALDHLGRVSVAVVVPDKQSVAA